MSYQRAVSALVLSVLTPGPRAQFLLSFGGRFSRPLGPQPPPSTPNLSANATRLRSRPSLPSAPAPLRPTLGTLAAPRRVPAHLSAQLLRRYLR